MSLNQKKCVVSFEYETSIEPVTTQNAKVEIDAGSTIVQAAYQAGVVIQQTCGGTPSCTDCKVKIVQGLNSNIAPPEGPETRLMGNVSHMTLERLACQAIILGDVSVYVPLYQRTKKQSSKLKRK
jgi:ferredoxin